MILKAVHKTILDTLSSHQIKSKIQYRQDYLDNFYDVKLFDDELAFKLSEDHSLIIREDENRFGLESIPNSFLMYIDLDPDEDGEIRTLNIITYNGFDVSLYYSPCAGYAIAPVTKEMILRERSPLNWRNILLEFSGFNCPILTGSVSDYKEFQNFENEEFDY